MRTIRFQNKVATSSFTLPVAALIATLLWVAKGDYSLIQIAGWAGCGLTTYLMAEFNNSNALLRIRSRLISTVYLISVACFSFLHPFQESTAINFFILASLFFLFRSYQSNHPSGSIFRVFFCLGVAALFQPQLLWLTPLYYWAMIAYMRSMSFRSFFASILGILTPVWFFLGYICYINDWPEMIRFCKEIYHFPSWSLQQYFIWDIQHWASYAWLLVISMIATIHTLRTSYNDKIRTRMYYQTLILFEVVLLILTAAAPAFFPVLFSLSLLTASPVIAHFFALTHLKITNILFIISIFIFIILAAFNLWISSCPLSLIFS